MAQERTSSSHVVNIHAMANNVQRMLAAVSFHDEDQDVGAPTCLISNVAEPIRNVAPHDYDPEAVTIGPYNRHPRSYWMQQEKHRLLKKALSICGAREVQLEHVLEEMASLEHRASRCYASTFDMTKEEFVQILLLDGCYLLLTFDVASTGQSRTELIAKPKLDKFLMARDVFCLVENQIPFFVLDEIYQLISRENRAVVVDHFAWYTKSWLESKGYTKNIELTEPRPCHLLHLLHMYFRRPVTVSAGSKPTATGRWHREMRRWRRATEYQMAGINFKKRKLDGSTVKSVLDVWIDGSTLEVPCLMADYETSTVLRNLMFLEQRNSWLGSHVTAYCIFLSQTACTTEDVALLSGRGVIVNLLGNDVELAKCFADLCRGIYFDSNEASENYLRPVWEVMERRYQRPVLKWMTWLRQKYFHNPWLAMGLAAALLGLVCTVLQAIFAILSYANGPM